MEKRTRKELTTNLLNHFSYLVVGDVMNLNIGHLILNLTDIPTEGIWRKPYLHGDLTPCF